MLRKLKKLKIKLFLVTNDSKERAINSLVKTGLRKFFDLILVSEEIGHEKSTGIPFKILLNRSKLKAKDIIVIGDSLKHDIIPAKKLGMISVRILRNKSKKELSPKKEEIPDYEIKNLYELNKLLTCDASKI
jgi:putative hydrolase of the HAD superfamily